MVKVPEMPMKTHDRMLAKATYKLGANILSDLMLPTEIIRGRSIKKAEDSIPIGMRPIVRRDYDELGNEKIIIEGYDDRPVYADFSQGLFFLIVAPPGAGKTILMKGMIGELEGNGYYLCCLADMKNDFYECMKPAQESLAKLLPYWRRPRALPVAPLVPLYVPHNNPNIRVPDDVQRFQLSIKDMRAEDIIYALKLDERSPAQVKLLKNVWSENDPPSSVRQLAERIRDANATKLFSDMGLEIEGKMGEYANSTKASLLREIGRLSNEKFFGEETTVDILGLIERGRFVDVCLFETKMMMDYHNAYTFALMRKIYEAKEPGGRLGQARRLVLLAPDIGTTMLPNRKNTASKDYLINQVIALGRKRSLYLVGDTQNLNQVPEEALLQVQSWVVFARTTGNDLERIAKATKRKYSDLRQQMEDHQQEMERKDDPVRGVLFWQPAQRPKIMFVPPPCSSHEVGRK